MNCFYEGLIPLSCVLSRGMLQIIDRYFLGIKQLDVHLQLWLNVVFSLLLGLFISFLFIPLSSFTIPFMAMDCFLGAVILQLVSYAFSYTFKYWEVREVIMTTKFADLVCIPILCALLLKVCTVQEAPSLFHESKYLSYIVGYCSCIPLLIGRKDLRFLVHPASLLLIASLFLQVIFALLIKKESFSSFEQGIQFTLGIFVWRSIFSTAIVLFRNKKIDFGAFQSGSYKDQLRYVGQILGRSCLMLIAYVTFVFSIELQQPMIVFPILNSSPLVAALLAQLILKEKLFARDIIAFFGLSCSSIL